MIDWAHFPFLSLSALSLGLATDAFAVSVAQGACCRPRLQGAAWIALVFGVAQGTMPLLGWGLGTAFDETIRNVDHWIAFALLALLGFKMVREGLQGEADMRPLRGWALISAGVATSVDAAAAGITLPVLGAPVLLACATIGSVTAILCFAGVRIGAAWGAQVGRKAEIGGGLLLVAIGAKIWVDHQFLGG